MIHELSLLFFLKNMLYHKSMEVIDITSEEQLNNLVSSQKYSQFLQSWQWGEFHQNLGAKVWRLGVKEGNEILAVASLIKKSQELFLLS